MNPRPTGPAKVFITYRREETSAHAGRLYDAMVARFGKKNVFMDVDMKPGVDFVAEITHAVAACHVLIVVMGPRWATIQDEEGKIRIQDPEDFVRLEVETGLRRPDVTPIPVLVAGARMPDPDDLPPKVRPITRRNALDLSHQHWHDDVRRLITTLDELLKDRNGLSLWRRALAAVVRAASSRRLVAVAAAAVVLAVLAALAVALLRDGADETWARVDAGASVLGGGGKQEILGVATLPSGGAVAVGRSGATPAVWTFDGSDWSADDLSGERGVMWGALSAGDRLFAVGSKPDTFGQTDAVVWLRPEGPWRPAVCDDCGGRGRQVAYAAIRRTDGSFVAVGHSQGADDTFDAAVWLSSDRGESWARAAKEDSDLAAARSQVMKDVVELRGRLIAVGRDGDDAAVWTSADGFDWSRVPSSVLVAPTGSLEMNSVTRIGSRVIAVGREQRAPGAMNAAAAWIGSSQGATWKRGSGDFVPRGQQMRAVAAAPPEVVAVGFDHGAGPAAAVWSSVDGENWTAARSGDFGSDGDVGMSSVVHLGSDTLLGGGSESGDAAIWASSAP